MRKTVPRVSATERFMCHVSTGNPEEPADYRMGRIGCILSSLAEEDEEGFDPIGL